ncbi:MAG TPA: DNA-3-methyladenine glycosylase [Thermoleophilia bacterium]|nr:DNA-3-methyladenine glycosylase [Thermoleophilia bacterium]
MAQSDPRQPSFFARPTLAVARDLIGRTFLFDGVGGRIVETEAYAPDDPSSHAFRGRTARNAVMFGPPGYLYVYFVYGMHFCANLSCEEEGVGAAVLLRALEPLWGLEQMTERRGTQEPRLLCSGPARLTQALGITRAANGLPVTGSPAGTQVPPGASTPRLVEVLSRPVADAAQPRIATAPRVGINDDGRPWRFLDASSGFVSRPAPRR